MDLPKATQLESGLGPTEFGHSDLKFHVYNGQRFNDPKC